MSLCKLVPNVLREMVVKKKERNCFVCSSGFFISAFITFESLSNIYLNEG